jgi:hypothetical protein
MIRDAPATVRPRIVRSSHEPSPGSLPSTSNRGWKENLEHSLPFLLGGSFCVGLAVWLGLSGAHELGLRHPLWPLLVGIGVTLGGGGIALTLVDESPQGEAPALDDRYVLVERTEWERWQRSPPSVALVPGVSREPGPLGSAAAPFPAGSGAPPSPSPSATPGFDPSLVTQLSEELLRASPSSETATSPARAQSGATGPRGPVPTAPAPSPRRSTVGKAPRPGTSPSSPQSPLAVPLNPEIEATLAQLEMEAARALPAARPTPAVANGQRCIGCGAAVAAYSEQACILCERPLCDACLEESISDERPAVCPTCHPPPST